MSVITAVLDAANLAHTAASHRGRNYDFQRVLQVRDLWQTTYPGGSVHAVLDASVRRQMLDERPVAAAQRDGWLEVAPGDADDPILDLASRHGAAIVSNDNFADARDRHPWLQGCSDRVYSVIRRRGNVSLQPRPLKVLTREEIERAKRERAVKAGIRHDLGDRSWRCTAEAEICPHADQDVPHSQLRHRGSQAFCVCGYPAREIFVEADPVPGGGPVEVAVLHGHLFRHSAVLGAGPIVFGRGGPDRPHVHDVTAGLPREEARDISREHVELLVDDDGYAVARHLAPRNATFLNPRLGADRLPADNRMVDGAEYLVTEGDLILLGSGFVGLVVSVPRRSGT